MLMLGIRRIFINCELVDILLQSWIQALNTHFEYINNISKIKNEGQLNALSKHNCFT